MYKRQAADNDSDDDDDDDDGGFLGSYRRRRLEQLKAAAGRPQFGQIQEAERSNFVSAVDTEDPRTSVVVHLYEPYIGACRRMNRFLEVGGGGMGCAHVMHGRGRMTMEPCIPTMPGRSTSGFSPTKQTLPAPTAKRREVLGESHEG